MAALQESGALTIGFLALAGAVATGHSTPATGYELSLYAATPTIVWILLGISFCISLLVSLETGTPWRRHLSLSLGVGSAVAFVGMPVIRGYRFISGGDALTHLGWARGIQDGTFNPLEFRYPGLHSVSTLVSTTTGFDLMHAMMLVIVLLFALFFLFTALTTSVIFESRYSAAVGAFSAFLLLPITTLSTFMTPHPMSQAILLSTVTIYLFVKYVPKQQTPVTVSAVGSLLATTSLALVLYHPQLAAHFLAVFVGICALQILCRRFWPSTSLAEHQPMYAQTGVLAAAFVIWVVNHGLIRDAIEYHLVSTLEYFLGENEAAGTTIDAQSDSIAQIGGSVVEIVLKLLGPSLVFGAIVAGLVLWTVRADADRLRWDRQELIHYFTVGLVALAGLFGLYFFGSTEKMYFRVFGLMMLFLTIPGAVAIAYGTDALATTRSTTAVHGCLVLGFGVLLVVSLLAVFPSPYTYGASPHVTDHSLDGHELAFDYSEEDVSFVGIRTGPNRYADVDTDQIERTERYGGIDGSAIEAGISQQYAEDQYLVVNQHDLDRELVAFQELRYTERQMNAITRQSGVNQVQSNGEFHLYYVRGTAEA